MRSEVEEEMKKMKEMKWNWNWNWMSVYRSASALSPLSSLIIDKKRFKDTILINFL